MGSLNVSHSKVRLAERARKSLKDRRPHRRLAVTTLKSSLACRRVANLMSYSKPWLFKLSHIFKTTLLTCIRLSSSILGFSISWNLYSTRFWLIRVNIAYGRKLFKLGTLLSVTQNIFYRYSNCCNHQILKVYKPDLSYIFQLFSIE